VVEFAEKPKKPKSALIAMCLYYFPQAAAIRIKEYLRDGKNSSDAAGSYIKWLAGESTVYGYCFSRFWVDIGNKQTYDMVNAMIQRKE